MKSVLLFLFILWFGSQLYQPYTLTSRMLIGGVEKPKVDDGDNPTYLTADTQTDLVQIHTHVAEKPVTVL